MNSLPASLPGAMIAALLGAAAAWINYRITKRAAEKAGSGGSAFLTAAPMLRMLLSAGLLAAVYFIGPLTPWNRVWLLAGAAVGLTVPLFVFTALLVRQVNGGAKSDPPSPEKGSDRHG